MKVHVIQRGATERLRGHAPHAFADDAVVMRRAALAPTDAFAWARRVLGARRRWTKDFGGEQHALGRAFYTHLETERAGLYFGRVAASDALVERVVPGLQRWTRELFADIAGGVARQRPGFAGAGVHIFEPGSKVARSGGVVHFDVEGLAPLHRTRRARALSLVVMLQPPTWGGGLRVWDALYAGSEQPSDDALGSRAVTLRYGAGDALMMSSYRLHQIRPFRGASERVSITLHGVEVDRGVFETWF